MFLGSGDLRNAFLTASLCSEAYETLDIHVSDGCEIVTARNFLISHILSSFNPPSNDDIDYLWSIWYGLQWNEATRTRFVRDVKHLLAMPWSNSESPVILHETKVNACIKRILNSWLNTVCNMSSRVVDKIKQQRYAEPYKFIICFCLILNFVIIVCLGYNFYLTRLLQRSFPQLELKGNLMPKSK